MLGLFSKTYNYFAFHSPFLGTGKAGFCDVQSPCLALLLGEIDIGALGQMTGGALGFGESFHGAKINQYAGIVKKIIFLDSRHQCAYNPPVDHYTILESLAWLIIAGAVLCLVLSLGRWWVFAKRLLIAIGAVALIALLVMVFVVWQMRRV